MSPLEPMGLSCSNIKELMMKKLKSICLIAIFLEVFGLIMLFLQPEDCSPFIGIAFVILGLVVAICAWIFWHFIKYD